MAEACKASLLEILTNHLLKPENPKPLEGLTAAFAALDKKVADCKDFDSAESGDAATPELLRLLGSKAIR